ncbi:MAG: phosphoserine phosphatase SerB [Boseongicola sp.]|nr:MAG: phosphoserine phosphatase SerB [Boseongicola sp.]
MISLIAQPGKLDPALVSSLQSAWGGGDAHWLAPDEAAEFPAITTPSNISEVRSDIAGMGVDVNVLPSGNRRKKLLIADMDSTMINQECIDELAAEAGVGDRVSQITARAMNGELDFDAAIDERVGLLKGLGTDVIEKVLQDRITLAAGGQTLVATMKGNGVYAALVSGGFVQFTSAISRLLGFDENRANTLIEDGDILSGTVQRPILGQEAKVEALEEITARLGVSPDDAIAVGDGANDLAMIHRAGLGVALHAKPAVAAAAPIKVNHGDLTALLFLQGYEINEFITN